MEKKNIIILMIDGGRLDYAQDSKIFSEEIRDKLALEHIEIAKTLL